MNTDNKSILHIAALCYAKFYGLHVFPCKPGTKVPLTEHGALDATTDLDQINAWWTKWPDANVAWNPGKSGHIVVDKDMYKPEYAAEGWLDREEENTVTVLTPQGGEQLWYKCDVDEFGNSTGTIPTGVDIRCRNAYGMLPKSIHPNGGEYAFESGYSIRDMEPIPLPDKIRQALEQAKQEAVTPVHLNGNGTAPPLNPWLEERANEVPPKGGRSEHDFGVIISLISEGATDDEIQAVFQSYPIGTHGKYAEQGDRYLAHSIAKARQAISADGPPKDWAGLAKQAIHNLQTQPIFEGRTRAVDKSVTIAFLTICIKAHKNQVSASLDNLRHIANLGSTASVRASIERNPYIERVEEPVFGLGRSKAAVYKINVEALAEQTCTLSTHTYTFDKGCKFETPFVDDVLTHISDNAFSTGQSVDAKLKARAERKRVSGLPQGLGKNALDVILLMRHEGLEDESEIAERMGVGKGVVKRVLKRLDEHDIDPESPEVWNDLVVLEPTLRTWRINERREIARHEKGYYFAKERSEAAESDEERSEYDRLAEWHLNRATPLRAALDGCSEGEARGVCRRAEYDRRAKLKYHILRAKKQAQRVETMQAEKEDKRKFESEMRRQGIPYREWSRYRELWAQSSSYDETEIVFREQEMQDVQV